MSGTATSTVTSADGTTIACETLGSGPALVMVDGALCHRDAGPLRSLAALLAETFTVHLYDRRGRGASADTQPYAVEREIEDLAAVVAAAGSRASVYGVSSGALLAMRAAAAGVPIERLAVFEPPIGEDAVSPSQDTIELTKLMAEGRRSDTVERFMTGIGVPEQIIAGMKPSPAWPALAAIAPTIIYDCTICDTTTLAHIRAVSVPALVLDSEGSTDDLTGWSAAVLAALPHGTRQSLAGQWHVVPDADLAPALRGFFLDG
jgi:pimeloyl-ACP methyl ester carboxylesterase